jgi:hypothetical protein
MDKYYLKASFQPDWVEVTKEEFIRAERGAGFRPKCASSDPQYMTTCATGGFSSGSISGRVQYIREPQEPTLREKVDALLKAGNIEW